MYTVYILKCSDNSYYVGCTTDFNDRLARHQKGQVNYTSKRLPVQLVHQSIFIDKYKSFEFEIYLKTASGRPFANKRLYGFK